jgi:methyl-accepting chemotaxis protein
MRLAQAVRVGSWLLVGLNLLMAVGTIAIFTRMAPAIATIIEHNERTLKACEDMLAVMAVTGAGSPFSHEQARIFQTAFDRAKANITEPQEPEILKRMEPTLPPLFQGDTEIRKEVVEATVQLGKINRDAMTIADQRAQQLGRAGAWGVVFMALTAFLAGVIFIRKITRRVVTPLEEIHTVIIAHRNGETMRRCTGTDLSQDVVAVFTGINDLLDQCQALAVGGNGIAEFGSGRETDGDRCKGERMSTFSL